MFPFHEMSAAKSSHPMRSVAWMELGNELHASRVSLQKFHTLLSQRLPFLRHVQVNAVLVVDHLGRNIPVPTQFCSTWEVSFVLPIYQSAHISWSIRIFTTSSTVIAGIESGIALSNVVTIKCYVPKIAKSSSPQNSRAQWSQEWFSKSA
jgi:hypothetical protein